MQICGNVKNRSASAGSELVLFVWQSLVVHPAQSPAAFAGRDITLKEPGAIQRAANSLVEKDGPKNLRPFKPSRPDQVHAR